MEVGLAWGSKGHYWISTKAIDCLEGRLRKLFSRQRAYILKHCMDADYRKDQNPDEYYRHFVNLDRYGGFPFPQLDLDEEKLTGQLGKETVLKNGTLLWASEKTFRNLVTAFGSRNEEQILHYASDLAHYIGDLHQPLHTVENYDGQLTGQRGIHFRFEGDLVNLHLDNIRFLPSPPADLGPLLPALYEMALNSFQWVDNILVADLKTVAGLGTDRSQFVRTKKRKGTYPDQYYTKMLREVGTILTLRLNRAAQSLASLWWMAWEKADRPEF